MSVWAAIFVFAANPPFTPMQTSWKIARAAILSALSWLLLILAASLPTGRLFVLTLASFLLAAACQELGLAAAALVYLASSILALIWPGPLMVLLYALCFGLLPLVIYLLRRHVSPFWTRLLTHVLMTGLVFLIIQLLGLDRFFKGVFPASRQVLTAAVLLAFQLFLFVYYYALQYFEVFYSQRIAPWLRRKG
ncbi:MAG TPA: hypothetical protein VFD14_05985 [Clostridia bacterium]|nr:hypothetical protein [Clostridia bacterium]